MTAAVAVAAAIVEAKEAERERERAVRQTVALAARAAAIRAEVAAALRAADDALARLEAVAGLLESAQRRSRHALTKVKRL